MLPCVDRGGRGANVGESTAQNGCRFAADESGISDGMAARGKNLSVVTLGTVLRLHGQRHLGDVGGEGQRSQSVIVLGRPVEAEPRDRHRLAGAGVGIRENGGGRTGERDVVAGNDNRQAGVSGKNGGRGTVIRLVACGKAGDGELLRGDIRGRRRHGGKGVVRRLGAGKAGTAQGHRLAAARGCRPEGSGATRERNVIPLDCSIHGGLTDGRRDRPIINLVSRGERTRYRLLLDEAHRARRRGRKGIIR